MPLSDAYPTNPSLEVGQVLFNVINLVVIRRALQTPWSSFCTYDLVDQHNLTPDDAKDAHSYIWGDVAPVATCIGQSYLISTDICAAFLQHTDLVQYANAIKMLSNEDYADSDHRYHMITALMFEEYVIVADLTNHTSAFTIKLGDSFQCQERFVWGRRDQAVFKYWMDEHGKRHLSWKVRDGKGWKDAIWEHTHESALRQLGIPGAQQTIAVDESGQSVPPAKSVMCRTLLDEQPKHGWYTKVENKFMIYTCQVLVDFQHRCIKLQIPNEDWLQKPANADILRRLQVAADFKTVDDATAEMRVQLGKTGSSFGKITKRDIKLMGQISIRLGLPIGEVVRMGKAVYRVWNRLEGEQIPLNWPEVYTSPRTEYNTR
jgi:hypothetical protein